MKKLHIETPYPTVNGFPVNPLELELPRTRFEEVTGREVNNHHWFFTKRRMGLLAMTRTLRNLDEFQTVLPTDVHSYIHYRHGPQLELPTPYDMVDYLEEAYDQGKLLKFGSANNPHYSNITQELRSEYLAEYERLK